VNPQNPLLEIGERMRDVEQRLRSRDLSTVTQTTQQRIVTALDKLIEQLAAQQNSNSQRQQSPEQKPGDEGPQKTGKEAARDGGKPTGKTNQTGEITAAMRRTLSEFWGHLPDRVRRQMQSAQTVEFLPKYRKLIEEYYNRLAEERRDTR
jgi:hypothetical protein